MPTFMFKIFAGPYLAGNSLEKAIKAKTKIWQDSKLFSTIDLLGEEVKSVKKAQETVATYCQLIDKITSPNQTTISLKPSALGLMISYDLCQENLKKILNHCKKKKIPVTIDMEDSRFTSQTLRLYKKNLEEFPNLGTVLQSRLYRTKDDIKNLPTHPGRIRLCLGIYEEDQSIAWPSKQKAKENFLKVLEQLLFSNHYIEIATHDDKLINSSLELIKKYKKDNTQVEFQMLYGVKKTKTQKKIMSLGYKMRLYLPFSTDWNNAVIYLKRRMAENPNLIFYALKNFFKN